MEHKIYSLIAAMMLLGTMTSNAQRYERYDRYDRPRQEMRRCPDHRYDRGRHHKPMAVVRHGYAPGPVYVVREAPRPVRVVEVAPPPPPRPPRQPRPRRRPNTASNTVVAAAVGAAVGAMIATAAR